jgi:hypothetical protein
MASKRIIERDAKESEVPPAETGVPVARKEAPVAKKVEPLDTTVTIKPPGIFVMRVWNGMVLFPSNRKMAKIPIVPGKPVNIRITQ